MEEKPCKEAGSLTNGVRHRAYLQTAAGKFRSGSGCIGNASFYAFQVCSADPSRAYLQWYGTDGAPVMYGHADSRTCGGFAALSAGSDGRLPSYVADRLADPESTGQAGVAASSAKLTGGFESFDVYRLAGKDRWCILGVAGDGFSIGCKANKAGSEAVVSQELDSGAFRVYGIAAGVDRVVVTTASGEKTEAPVSSDGAFAVDTAKAPVGVDLSSGAETRSQLLRTR